MKPDSMRARPQPPRARKRSGRLHGLGVRLIALRSAGFNHVDLPAAAPARLALGGALVGGALFIAVLRRRAVAAVAPAEGEQPSGTASGLAHALAPYGVLVIGVVALAVARLWAPVDDA